MVVTHARSVMIWVGLSLSAIACGSGDPAPKEDTGSMKQAVCSGGGGGGDACVNGGSGYCPPECSTCFASVAQRIHLQNLWECTPGGGGGGSACATGSGCSNSEIRGAQSMCQDRCSPAGSDGIHECHLTYQASDNRLVSFTCACADGSVRYDQIGTWCR